MNIAPLLPYLFLVSLSAWFSFSACCCWRCGRSWAELAVLRRRSYPPPCIDIARLFQFSLFPTHIHKEKERKERLRGPEECFFFFLLNELGPHLPPPPPVRGRLPALNPCLFPAQKCNNLLHLPIVYQA